MKRPEISVCIPNYNHAAYLPGALESVVAQSLPPTEIIVVDDASTDDSVTVVRRLGESHTSIRLIQNPVNEGCFGALNRGLAAARGEYAYLLAADDSVSPGFFEKAVSLLEEYPQAGMCACAIKYVDGKGQSLDPSDLGMIHSHAEHVRISAPRYFSPRDVLRRLEKQPWFLGGVVHVLFRRAALIEAGGLPAELGLSADWFAVHYVALKHGMCYLPEPLAVFRVLSESFGSAIVQRPETSLEHFRRAIGRMTESRNRGVFPAAFVERKRREFTGAAFRGALVHSHVWFIGELQRLLPPRSRLDRASLRLLRWLALGERAVLRAYCFLKVAPALRNVPSDSRKNGVGAQFDRAAI